MRALGDQPVPDASFVELGTHRLRGLPEPELLYQLVVVDLPHEFPPLRVGP
jgi:class 3 adenylate cyclase